MRSPNIADFCAFYAQVLETKHTVLVNFGEYTKPVLRQLKASPVPPLHTYMYTSLTP